MMIPTNQIAAVFVTLSKDLVKASNILVIVTPPKLKILIEAIPTMTKEIRNPFWPIYLKYTLGSSKKGLLLSSNTQLDAEKWHGTKDKTVMIIVKYSMPKQP